MKRNAFRRGISLLLAPHIPTGSPARKEPLLRSGCSLGRDCGRSASARSAWRWLAFCMACGLALGCTGCGNTDGGVFGGLGASAASMFLRKAEGTVAVADAEGADVAPAENLGLYSGYTVGTEAESYAWIDLDKVKLAKLGENSAIEITKDGKNLTIDVASGSMFFNVTEPLADDETMEISTSSMLVGIRGTCGWVTQSQVGLLEGTVTVTAGDQTATVSAGERAVLTGDGTLQVWALSAASIPAFVARELLDDEALSGAVLEASGLYIPTTYEELLAALEKEEEVVYSEEIDFERDGSPEFLVITLRDSGGSHEDYSDKGHYPYRRLCFEFYRNGPDGVQCVGSRPSLVSMGMTSQTCSLAERDGRLFLECIGESATTGSDAQYFGSIAARDGGLGDWGETDCFSIQSRTVSSALPHDEKGFVVGGSKDPAAAGMQNPYTPVRELCRVDGLDVE